MRTGGATLRSTTDPAVLIPGSPWTVYADANVLTGRATELRDLAGDVISRTDTPTWEGSAYESWATRRDDLEAALRSVAAVYDAAAEGVQGHAETFTWARAQAQWAIDTWAAGTALDEAFARATGTSTTTHVNTAALPGAPLRELAQSVLDTATSWLAESDAQLAALLDGLSEGMPTGSFTAADFFTGLADWVKGTLSMTCPFVIIWNVSQAVSSGTFVDQLTAQRAALQAQWTQITTNPLTIPTVLFDTQTLHDRPGQWWGRIAPDIAITAATAGVGAYEVIGTRLAARTVRPALALTEQGIGLALDDIVSGSTFVKSSSTLAQFGRTGGFPQANLDFDRLVVGADVVDRGGGLRTATLANGTKVNVRATSSGGFPTLEVRTPGNPGIKVRY